MEEEFVRGRGENEEEIEESKVKREVKKVHSSDIERESTGVPELDKALEGGIPRGSWVAVTGEPGTGKSVLCMHFAYAGLQNDQKVIYVTTETNFRDVLRQARQFGMNFEEFGAINLFDVLTGRVKEPEGNIMVIDLFGLWRQYRELLKEVEEEETKSKRRPRSGLDINVLIAAIRKAYEVLGVAEEGKVKEPIRLIVDSLSAFWADKPAMARAYSYQLRLQFYRSNITAYLVSQYAITTKTTYGFGLEHIADGILFLWMDSVESTREVRRYLIIKKMRMTNHAKRAFKLDIIPGKGVTLSPL